MKKKISIVILIVFAIFLRFYNLGNIPAGLTNDEADKGYDAYSILPDMGLELLPEKLLLLWGIVVVLTLLLLAPIPDTLTSDGNYARASMMLPFLLIIEACGLYGLITYSMRLRKPFVQIIPYGSFILLGIITCTFFIIYNTYFRDYYSLFSLYGYEELMHKVASVQNSYDRIYTSRHLNDTKQYIYYLFYNQYNPVRFQ